MILCLSCASIEDKKGRELRGGKEGRAGAMERSGRGGGGARLKQLRAAEQQQGRSVGNIIDGRERKYATRHTRWKDMCVSRPVG
jgi:hypothetical protein